MKRLLITLSFAFIYCSCGKPEIKSDTMPTYETDQTFVDGEILLPDYVHTDTLIVTDAIHLNFAMQYYPAESDSDIYLILQESTKVYSLKK